MMIDDKLLRAERTWGRNVCAFELPVGLALPGLEKKDCQRIVYSAVLRSLKDRGFGVRILLEPDRTLLYLEWVTDVNRAEVDAMNRLIRGAAIQREEVESFLSRTGGPPPGPGPAPGA